MKLYKKILRCIGIVHIFYSVRLVFRYVYLLFLEFDYKTCAVMPLEKYWKHQKLIKWRNLVNNNYK